MSKPILELVHLHVHSESRFVLSPSTKNAEDNGDNFARCNLGHPNVTLHTQPQMSVVSQNLPVVAGHTSRSLLFTSIVLHSVSQTRLG